MSVHDPSWALPDDRTSNNGAAPRPMLPDLRAFWALLRGHRIGLLAVLVCLAGAAATEPAMVMVIKETIDWGTTDTYSWLPYPVLPSAILLLFVCRGGAAAAASYLMGGICADAVTVVQRRLYRDILAQPGRQLQHLPLGKLVHLLTFEVKQCSDLLERVTTKLIRHVLTLVGLYASLFMLNWRLTVAATLAVPLVLVVCWRLLDRVRQLTTRQIGLNETLAALLIERARKQKLVKLHGTAVREVGHFQQLAVSLRKCNLGLYTAVQSAAPVTQVLVVMLLALIVVWMMHVTGLGMLSKGGAVAYVTNLLLVLTPLKNLAELNGPVLRSIVGMQSMLALACPPALTTEQVQQERPEAKIELHNVTVTYPHMPSAALAAFSVRVKAGQVVAIVGPSGAGKSTLFQVLRANVRPNAGEVRISGQLLEKWTPAALSRQIAVVTQQPQLFNRSVLENVAYGDAQPDRARVWKALADVNMSEAVAAMPFGLDTEIGIAGERLSGGQARLLTLARAFYSVAPIVLLDEPTASLDPLTESIVCQSLERLRGRQTVLVITHCHGLAARADRVLRIEDGRLVGDDAGEA